MTDPEVLESFTVFSLNDKLLAKIPSVYGKVVWYSSPADG